MPFGHGLMPFQPLHGGIAEHAGRTEKEYGKQNDQCDGIFESGMEIPCSHRLQNADGETSDNRTAPPAEPAHDGCTEPFDGKHGAFVHTP